MIFLTIGTQEPFDRLVKAMDEIAPYLDEHVVAQVSKTTYKAKNMETYEFLAPTACEKYFSDAKLIVSHAGMGTIISALVNKKPLLVVPRLAKYGEHRNDHQLATAKAFEKQGYVHVVYDVQDLQEKLIDLLQQENLMGHQLGKYASKELLTSIQEFMIS